MFSEEEKQKFVDAEIIERRQIIATEKLVNPMIRATTIRNKNPNEKSVERLSKTQLDADALEIAHMNKDEHILRITSHDFILQRKIQEEKFRRLADEPDDINNGDLNAWDRHAMTRYVLFRGDLTDDKGQIKNDISEMSTQELLKLIKTGIPNTPKEQNT